MATQEKTIAVYQKDATLTTHTTVLSFLTPLTSLPPETQSLFKVPPAEEDKSEPYVLTTESTIFHAQGGGQPSDTGTIAPRSSTNSSNPAIFTVHQVRKLDPAILHLGVFNPPDGKLTDREPIEMHIDVAKRQLHSRLHTAGHALSLAIRSLSTDGKLATDLREVKASHYPGAAFVEFQGLIPGTAKDDIQQRIDDLVSQDLGIQVHFWSEAEAKAKCAVVLDGIQGGEEGVRVVEIGSLGSYPCGGTHVQTLKELGKVVVRNIKRQKGISKVGYEVVDA